MQVEFNVKYTDTGGISINTVEFFPQRTYCALEQNPFGAGNVQMDFPVNPYDSFFPLGSIFEHPSAEPYDTAVCAQIPVTLFLSDTPDNPPTGGDEGAAISLSYRVDSLGSYGVVQGLEYKDFPPIPDAPTKGQYGILEFGWSLLKAIAITAAVAVVAAAAVAITIATCGAGAPAVAAAIVIGGAAVVGAGAATGGQVVSDVVNQSSSTWDRYAQAGIGGAISSATTVATLYVTKGAAGRWAGAAGGAAGTFAEDVYSWIRPPEQYGTNDIGVSDYVVNTALGYIFGPAKGTKPVPSLNAGTIKNLIRETAEAQGITVKQLMKKYASEMAEGGYQQTINGMKRYFRDHPKEFLIAMGPLLTKLGIKESLTSFLEENRDNLIDEVLGWMLDAVFGGDEISDAISDGMDGLSSIDCASCPLIALPST